MSIDSNSSYWDHIGDRIYKPTDAFREKYEEELAINGVTVKTTLKKVDKSRVPPRSLVEFFRDDESIGSYWISISGIFDKDFKRGK